MKKTVFLFLVLFSSFTLGGCMGGADQKSIQDEVTKVLEGEEFDKKVEASIERYVKKQQEAAQKAEEEASKPQKVENVSVDDDPAVGDANAPVTIVEFSDYECPFCGRHITDVYPEIKKKYIDTGKARLVFRDFPLEFHKNALPASMAANCAKEQGGDAKYFEMHDKLFTNQKDLNNEGFKKFAGEIGIDGDKLVECVTSEKYKDEIQKDSADGQKYGVQGTPGFFINGWFIKGAYPFSEFEKYIEQELAGGANPNGNAGGNAPN